MSRKDKPKKKNYQSQSYYIIKLISGGYICYMAYQLIMEGLNGNSDKPILCYVIGALFAVFGIQLFVRTLVKYLKYTRTNGFEDEVFGTKSEEADLDPDEVATPAKVEKKTIREIVEMSAGEGESEDSDMTEPGAKEE